MSEQQTQQPESGEKPPEGKGQEQTFTQADIDKTIDAVIARERKKHAAEVKELKTKAEAGATAEERIAALEQEIETSKREALRAKYAADVPERLRPLLTGTTEDELKSQRDLLIEGESQRKQQNNVSPREGNNPSSTGGGIEHEFVRSLFGRE